MSQTPPEWAADIAISATLAKQLIEAQFPELSPVALKSFDEGWDNALFLVNHEYVFRFPRRQIAVELLTRELRALPLVRDCLPLPVPLPEFIGNPSNVYPCPFFGYRRLPGRCAAHAGVGDDARIAGAETLGSFLKALHAVPVKPFQDAGVGTDTMHRLVPEKRVPKIQRLLQKAVEHGWVQNRAPLDRMIERAAIAPPPHQYVIVHGDFHIKNLLVGDDGLPCAVVDWGDMHLGHPATDLAIGCAYLPKAGRARFVRAYGNVDAITWRLAVFRTLFIALVLLDYGEGIGDELLMAEAKRSLDHAVEAERDWA